MPSSHSFTRLAVSRLQILLLLGCLLAPFASARAQTYTPEEGIEEYDYPLMDRGSTLQAYSINPYLVQLIPTEPDTLSLNFYHRQSPESRSVAMGYLSNMASPWHNKSFFDRVHDQFTFPFNAPFSGMIYTPRTELFYNTKAPYTKVSYQQHGTTQQREGDLDITLALNPNKTWGVGGDLTYTDALGYYLGSRTKAVGWRLFSSYSSPKYEAWLSLGGNTNMVTENGGVQDDRFISEPDRVGAASGTLKAEEVPVKYSGQVWNGVGNFHLKLAHRYNLGSFKPRTPADSLTSFGELRPAEDSLRYIPVAGIGHLFDFRLAHHEFVSRNPNANSAYPHQYAYYHTALPDSVAALTFLPYDSTYTWQINNTVQLSMREGFRPWVKFGTDLYVRLENKFYHQQDTIPGSKGNSAAFNTVIGGHISRTEGTGLNFDILGEFTLLGENLGNLLVQGDISSQFTLWQIPVKLQAWGTLRNERPDYFLRHFHGSFHRWDTEWGAVRSLQFGGRLSLSKWGTSVEAHSGTLQNLLYFGEDALPRQEAGAVQVLAARLKHAYKWGILGWDLEALYQFSSNSQALPLPMLSLRGQLYIDFYIASVMRTQIGADCSVHTPYNAPYYEPAVMQFTNQTQTKYGYYPLLNVFANFKLQRTRFFVEYYNLADLFLRPSNRFSLAHYPMLPASFRMGISVDFFN